MTGFPDADAALTHILVVADPSRSRRWDEEVLGAEVYRAFVRDPDGHLFEISEYRAGGPNG